MGRITVIGLGPGDFGLMTMEAWELMQQADHLYLRTAVHPTVEEIVKRGISFDSYDSYYEKAESFEALYESIARDVVAKAADGMELVYAVPGSPMVAEKTVVLLREYAHEAGVELDIKPGMSFAEIMYSKLGLDPIEGITIIDAFSTSLLQLTDFLCQLIPYWSYIIPIKAHLCSLMLHLLSLHQGWQAIRNSIQLGFPVGFFLLLNSFPAEKCSSRIRCLYIAKYMRMPSYQLLSGAIYHILHGKISSLLRHPGMEHHLHQEITKLFTEKLWVFLIYSLQHFIGFLNKILPN